MCCFCPRIQPPWVVGRPPRLPQSGAARGKRSACPTASGAALNDQWPLDVLFLSSHPTTLGCRGPPRLPQSGAMRGKRSACPTASGAALNDQWPLDVLFLSSHPTTLGCRGPPRLPQSGAMRGKRSACPTASGAALNDQWPLDVLFSNPHPTTLGCRATAPVASVRGSAWQAERLPYSVRGGVERPMALGCAVSVLASNHPGL